MMLIRIILGMTIMLSDQNNTGNNSDVDQNNTGNDNSAARSE